VFQPSLPTSKMLFFFYTALKYIKLRIIDKGLGFMKLKKQDNTQTSNRTFRLLSWLTSIGPVLALLTALIEARL